MYANIFKPVASIELDSDRLRVWNLTPGLIGVSGFVLPNSGERRPIEAELPAGGAINLLVFSQREGLRLTLEGTCSARVSVTNDTKIARPCRGAVAEAAEKAVPFDREVLAGEAAVLLQIYADRIGPPVRARFLKD